MLHRSPCKVSEPYDNPFWGFSYVMKREEKRRRRIKIPKTKKVTYLSLLRWSHALCWDQHFKIVSHIFDRIILNTLFEWTTKSL